MIDPNTDLEKLAQTPPTVRIGYILTQEGRVWSEEGILHATDMVSRKYPLPPDAAPDSGILWNMGATFNAPTLLAELLRKRPDSFIILSLPDSIVLLPNHSPDSNLAFADWLDENSDRTSWAVLTALYREASAKQEKS